MGLAMATDNLNLSGTAEAQGGMDCPAGAVNYKDSKVINGDVKSGSNISCGGDLWINGMIEDSKISVKGDLFCNYGFVGFGGGVIEAGGDVNLGHVKNQTVISLGGVNIAREALNSSIEARKSINAASVVGGTLSAGRSIVIRTAGSINGVTTTLQINPEAESVNELTKIETELKTHEANIKKLIWTLETLPQAKRDDKEFVRKLKNTIITVKYQITALEAAAHEKRTVMDKFENSFVHIEHRVYPGTVVHFGQRNITLAATMTGGRTLRVVNSQIKIL